MLKRSLGSLALLAILAACGGKEPVPEVEPSAPPSSAVPARDLVSAEDIQMSWTGEFLQTELKSTALFSATPSDGGVLVERVATGEADSSGPTNGARLHSILPTLGDTSGAVLNVEVMARVVGSETGAFRVAYSTHYKGNSGWHDFELTDEFAPFAFTYTIRDGEDLNGDYIGFAVEAGTVVEISEVNIR